MPERTRDDGWNNELTGRRVDFYTNRKLAWGIEITFPIGPMERKEINRWAYLKIPKHISEITFLDLNPQESLPVHLRNISSRKGAYTKTSLNQLARPGFASESREQLGELFGVVFGMNEKQSKKFNGILKNSSGNTIVIVEAHASEDPWMLGEQARSEAWQFQNKIQRAGNSVPVVKILTRYNDPKTYAAIVFAACHTGKKDIPALKVPIAYVSGEVWGKGYRKGLVPVNISTPRHR